MRWKANVTVAAVIEKDGRFLMIEESIDGQKVLNQPAGHLERNESLLNAVKREVLEETLSRKKLLAFTSIPGQIQKSLFYAFAFPAHLFNTIPIRNLMKK